MRFSGRKHIVCLATALCGGAAAASALTLDLESPGQLDDALSEVSAKVDELVLTGRIGADELAVLRDRLPDLSRLDMSRLHIVPAEIPPYAFAAMGLTSVLLPDDVRVIGEAAFAAIPAAELVLPQRLDSIAPYAFAHSGLAGVVIPAKTAVIGRNAFGDCRSLGRLSGGDGLKSVGEYAFHGCPLTEVDLSGAARLSMVGDGAFEGCKALYTVHLPETGGYTLGKGVFMGCGELHDITASVADLPALTFADAADVELSGIIDEGLATIGGYALSGHGAGVLTLPSTLDSIGEHGMERMVELTKIDARELKSVPALGEDVWDGVDQPMVGLDVGSGMSDLFKASDQWKEFRITDTSTSSLDNPAHDGGIALAFEGTVLKITAPVQIESAEVVTVDGMVLSRLAPYATEISMDASAWPGKVCIVMVKLSDGTSASFTLAR